MDDLTALTQRLSRVESKVDELLSLLTERLSSEIQAEGYQDLIQLDADEARELAILKSKKRDHRDFFTTTKTKTNKEN